MEEITPCNHFPAWHVNIESIRSMAPMRDSDAKFFRDTILDSIADGVFTVDEQWRITSFNRAAERITGVKRSQALGRPCREVFHATICDTACILKRTMTTGRPTVNKAVYIHDVHGNRIAISIATALLKDHDGKVIGGVETFRDLNLAESLRKELEATFSFADIVGHGAAMQQVFQVLPPIAESASTVLIEGASGTGKELVARAIHRLSPRRKKPFVALTCAALPDTLLESELFGYKAGTFTDARKDKPGRFALADGGTIFLDEIGDISPRHANPPAAGFAGADVRAARLGRAGPRRCARDRRHKQGPRQTG